MKVELVLTLYDALISGETVVRQNFCAQYGISERTFYRYIREISLHLIRNKNNGGVIDVQEPDGKYYLLHT